MNTCYAMGQSGMDLVEQALNDLKSRFDRNAVKAERGGKKRGKYGLIEPIVGFTRNIWRIKKFLRVAEIFVDFKSGRRFRFFAVEDEFSKRAVDRQFDHESFRPPVIVVHGNAYQTTIVHRIGNCLRAFFARIRRKIDRRVRRVKMARQHREQWCPRPQVQCMCH